jgi:predicted DNA-binding transcriptional regulator AlpA
VGRPRHDFESPDLPVFGGLGSHDRHAEKEEPTVNLRHSTPESGIQKQAELLTFREVAEKIGCSEYQLRVMINRGDGPPFVLIGRSKMFQPGTIKKWLVSRERHSLRLMKRNREIGKEIFTVTRRKAHKIR